MLYLSLSWLHLLCYPDLFRITSSCNCTSDGDGDGDSESSNDSNVDDNAP